MALCSSCQFHRPAPPGAPGALRGPRRPWGPRRPRGMPLECLWNAFGRCWNAMLCYATLRHAMLALRVPAFERKKTPNWGRAGFIPHFRIFRIPISIFTHPKYVSRLSETLFSASGWKRSSLFNGFCVVHFLHKFHCESQCRITIFGLPKDISKIHFGF